MEVSELLDYRTDILNDSRDEDGYVTNQLILSQVLPSMFESKLIDSDDFEECFHTIGNNHLTVDGHTINESEERLQLYVVDKRTADESLSEDFLLISNRSVYEKSFKAVSGFLKKSINGNMSDLQDSSQVKLLVSLLNSPERLAQIDVIEIFLISLTATVSFKYEAPETRSIYFDDEIIPVKWKNSDIKHEKEIMISRKVIDLNFLLNVQLSKGSREPLEVRFDKLIGSGIDAIKAASEDHFESYLCVLPADVLVKLYRKYSTRLLEKNVRSFLQFRGVNAGIKKTIREEPEKFIAYNNGLTITATDAKITNKKGNLQIQSLTDFQIVNGGQTTATIYFSKKEGLNLDNVKVMAKVNVAINNNEEELDDLISNISKYSNAQARVSNVDLKSRSPELIKLKQLSQSIVTPSGNKWFFERAKGEYQTIVRMKGKKSNIIKKEFPVERRFSKELLAKYYCAWGDEPYKVKKGGEKIFRHFIEAISNNDSNSPVSIDRDFYENTVSKIILFRKMEKIYGQGKNAMGQLRSAVIPYSISVVYIYSEEVNDKKEFNLSRIWKNEGLEDDLACFLEDLMLLMNNLIKKYSASEDYGEYSKKKELWDRIRVCDEVNEFMSRPDTHKIMSKYTINKI